MSQSRKVIKEFSALYLDGLLLDTTALGNLKLGANKVGSSSSTMGPIGLTGTQGPIGLTGADGPIGLTGTQGPIGLTGADGPTGLTGTQGPIGLTGADGPIGLIGADGPIGLTGTQGPIGLTGTMGPIGETGTQGSFVNLYVSNSITTGSLIIGIEGTAAGISNSGNITCNKITGSTGSSLGNLMVNDGITAGSLTIGTVEGIAASISDSGLITCTNITPALFSPTLSRETQGTSITTGINGNYSQFGSILTVSTSLPTQGSAAFSVQNAFVTTNTRVISNIVNYNGTGLPSVYVSSAIGGEFTVTLQNNSISDPLNGTVEIGFIALG
jgi:hypothetical protein